MSTPKSAAEPSPFLGQRLVSLDQFRGYTVAGMFLVNFLGKFDSCPEILKHHNTYNSYADTIMPGFFFAVGFAFRLTFGRRAHELGLSAAYWRVVRRFVGLGLFAIVFYGAGGHEPAKTWEALKELGAWDAVKDPLKRDWFQTLLHIAVTCLWLMPVIRAGALVRTLYMLGSAVLHVYLSYKFNFLWCNNGGNAIDGGPLGFLTWTIPTMIGTLACDAVVNSEGRAPLFKLSFAAIFLMLLGYGFSCGTRLYDLSPAELTAQKLALNVLAAPKRSDVKEEDLAKLSDEIRERFEKKMDLTEVREALTKALEAPQKQIKELSDERDKLKKDALAVPLDEYRKTEDVTGVPEWIVLNREEKKVDEIEAEFNAGGWPNPRIAELDVAIDKVKQEDKFKVKDAEFTIEGARDRLREIELQFKYDFPDLKLATDAVWPSAERIANLRTRYEEQGAIAVLAEPPFVPPAADDKRVASPPPIDHRLWNYWMMSQRAGTISYLTFAAGFNLLAYVLFYILGDMAGVKIGVFRTFGMNALAGYIAHDWTGGIIKSFMPEDVPGWYMWGGFTLFFCLTYLFIRTLEKQKIYLRL